MLSVQEPVIKLIPFGIIHPSPVNNRKDRTANIDDLVNSIRSKGVLQFPILRPHPSINGHFEIVCGERRCRACGELDMPVPARIEELSDREAHEITVTENLQREGLSPLEESQGICTLLNDGLTVEEVADKLGKSVRWVAKRAKLSNLTQSWLDALSDPDDAHGIQAWSGAHLEMVSRFESHIQDSFFSNAIEGRPFTSRGMTLNELRSRLESYLLNLKTAPWPLKDDSLDFDAGSCEACPKRTSVQVNLWDEFEDGKDHCIDRVCWVKKLEAYLYSRIEKLKEKYPDIRLLDRSCGDGFLGSDHSLKEGCIHYYQCHDCKKSDEGAIAALVIDGPGAGSLKHIKMYSNSYGSSSAPTGPKSLEDKRSLLERRRRILVIEKVIALLESEQQRPDCILKKSDEEIICTAIIWGCTRQDTDDEDDGAKFTAYGYGEWNDYRELRKRELSRDDLIVELMRCVIPKWCEQLKIAAASTAASLADAEDVCLFLGVDITAFEAEARVKLPEPKAWAKQAKAEEERKLASVYAEEESKPEKKSGAKGKKASKAKRTGKTGWTNPEVDTDATED